MKCLAVTGLLRTSVLLCGIAAATATAMAQHGSPEPGIEFPIDLTTAIRLAGENSPTIALAEARAREAWAAAARSFERFLPTLSAEWALVRHEGRTQSTEGTFLDVVKQYHRAGGRVSAAWDLNDALFESLAAKRRHAAARNAQDNASDSTILIVAHAYFELLLANAEAVVANDAVALTSDLVGQSERGLAAGATSEVDVARLRAQLAHQRVLYHKTQERAADASGRLASLLDIPQPVVLRPLDSVVVPLSLLDSVSDIHQWLRRAAESNPALQVARETLAASRWELRQSVWGPLLPDIEVGALFAGFGPAWSDLRDSRDYAMSMRWTVGPSGLLDFGRIRAQTARVSQREHNYTLVQNALAEQVARAYSQVRERHAMVGVARIGVSEAEHALALALDRREFGVGPVLEVIDATESLQRAELEFAQSTIDYNVAQIVALSLMGQIRSRFP